MNVWIIRAGKHGEREEWCLSNGYAGGGFTEIEDLANCSTRDEIKTVYRRCRPLDSDNRVNTNSGQLLGLRVGVKLNDLVVLPMKSGAKRVAIGRCVGLYRYLADEPQSRRHIVKVNWEKTDIPRSAVKQDLLYIFGGALSYFQAKRNDAVWRTEKLMETGVDPGSRVASTSDASHSSTEIEEVEVESIDVVETARDVIRAFIMENFKGHKLSELTAAILEAHGLTCVVSPPGPDKGIDILAGSGPLGLDEPRIVVQCKSEVGAVGSEVVQKILGVIGGVSGTQQGLLVAFGGINGPAKQLLTNQQYRVKVWDTDELIYNLLAVYDRINPEIRSEIPLQQVWTLASASE